MKIDNKLLDKIIIAIEWNIIPDEDFCFEEEFHESGRTYIANGTLKYEGNVYEFGWNSEFGIIYDTIELKSE